MITFAERKELFKTECKVVNLEYEYKSCDEEHKGCVGDTKWAIITDLSEQELKDKYADLIKRYTPFVLLTLERGEVIKEFTQNEDKFRKRQINNEDAFGYDEGMSEIFHNEIASPDYWQEKEEIEAREQREALLELIDKALDTLTPTQRKRLYAHLVEGKSSRTIAKEEGVNYSKVDKSIAAGIKKITKYFENGGAFQGGNSK
ncbi:putative uncharacterized protein [Clostridium sp. CAG:964]|nr:putative uncharacterized protein [Clostridium sp. CAG:964]